MNAIYQETLLEQAEQLCQQRNVRLTTQRMTVLRLMIEQPGAISAYELLELLRIYEPQAKPPTIYRALEFLLEQGFIHRIESTNSYVVCDHFTELGHTSALFICDRCGLITERTTESIAEHLQAMAEQSGFKLYRSVVEAHGFCASCVEARACNTQDQCEHNHSLYDQKKKSR